jgi:hypothetical protein
MCSPPGEGVLTLYMIMMSPPAWLRCANADRVSAPLDGVA